MKLEGENVLLRVYLRNTDKAGYAALSDTIVSRALACGLAGATVLRGIFGMDLDGQLLESHWWSLVEHEPVIVEIVDSSRAIADFLPNLQSIVKEGLVTLERAHVLVYRHSAKTVAEANLRLHLPGDIMPLTTVPSKEEFPAMKLSEDGQLLRIFIGESDVWEGAPLYRAIVLKAKELGLAGATVLHGTTGYGANSRLHTNKIVDVSTDLPIVVEIVDTKDKIESLLPFLDQSVAEGLITIEAVRVLYYRHNKSAAFP